MVKIILVRVFMKAKGKKKELDTKKKKEYLINCPASEGMYEKAVKELDIMRKSTTELEKLYQKEYEYYERVREDEEWRTKKFSTESTELKGKLEIITKNVEEIEKKKIMLDTRQINVINELSKKIVREKTYVNMRMTECTRY